MTGDSVLAVFWSAVPCNCQISKTLSLVLLYSFFPSCFLIQIIPPVLNPYSDQHFTNESFFYFLSYLLVFLKFWGTFLSENIENEFSRLKKKKQ